MEGSQVLMLIFPISTTETVSKHDKLTKAALGKFWTTKQQQQQNSKTEDSHIEKYRKHFTCISPDQLVPKGSPQRNFTPQGRGEQENSSNSYDYGCLQPQHQWPSQSSPILNPAGEAAQSPHCCVPSPGLELSLSWNLPPVAVVPHSLVLEATVPHHL